MPTESPLSKRIKRHVVGRIRTYFAATSPGFEQLCLNELQVLPLSVKQASVLPGGVEYKGRLHDCYLANLNLRSANRILMRIQTFKAANFNQLEKKLSDIPWELYLRAEQYPKIHVTTRHCRLYHTEAIAERFLASIAERMAKNEFTDEGEELSSFKQKVYVRGLDDRFTLSIDSSGDNLYKRGIKRHLGPAPLRETMAAAALMLAGYTGKEPLIDPMCGSGTLSLEAALIAKKMPPGWFRNFAFMNWPSFRPKRWEYLKRQSEKEFLTLKKPLIWASDVNPSACSQLEECIAKFNLLDAISVAHINFFELLPADMTDQIGLVAINPPYGRRIGSRRESNQLFKAVCNRLRQHYKGWKFAVVLPDKKLANYLPSQSRAYPFAHGGLKPMLMIGRIS